MSRSGAAPGMSRSGLAVGKTRGEGIAADTIQRHFDRDIRDVIADFPGVEGILAEHGIGCASCAVGSCLLRDVIEVHGLTVEQERALMRKIARVIMPGEGVEIPLIARKAVLPQRKLTGLSPPVRMLVDEHVLIKRVLALLPWMTERLGNGDGRGFDFARTALEFIRSYADRYHHAKEEEVLFAYFDPELEILKSMRKEHEIGRGHVRDAAAGLDSRDARRVTEHLMAYRELLTDHIRKEDEVLFPFLDQRLSMTQVGELFSRFTSIDREFGDTPKVLEGRISLLEEAARA